MKKESSSRRTQSAAPFSVFSVIDDRRGDGVQTVWMIWYTQIFFIVFFGARRRK